MGEHAFGETSFDPARNPAVLDTLTWNVDPVVQAVSSAGPSFWAGTVRSFRAGGRPGSPGAFTLFPSSAAKIGECHVVLGECPDGQHFVAEIGRGAGTLGREGLLCRLDAGESGHAAIYRADAAVLHAAFSSVGPGRLPSAMGAVPRLGIGTRMSRLCFPGIWDAIRRAGFSANVIQNSYRELNTLENILSAKPSRKLYLPGFGFLEEGHTGSTFEGLWVSGAAEALKRGTGSSYGADADHIWIGRGPEGMGRARRLVEAARYYSFYTLDVSDLVGCPAESPPKMRDLETFYREGTPIDGARFTLDGEELSLLVGKYGGALEAAQSLARDIAGLRRGEPFDLELSIDEHPPQTAAFDCLTGDRDLLFILSEASRRGIPLTHVAPNVGVEKLVDYRGADGLEGLGQRVSRLHAIARSFSVMLDFHSGDDLSAATRRTLREATGGQLHFKISPVLQNLLGEAVVECEPQLFREWWDATVAYASQCAAEGSAYARECIARAAGEGGGRPDPASDLFRAYCFAAVGRRDGRGRFTMRERFYSLSAQCHALYDRKVEEHLCTLAGDLFA